MADSENSYTGKVHHENLKLGKILQRMKDSPEFDLPEFDFIPRVSARCLHIFN